MGRYGGRQLLSQSSHAWPSVGSGSSRGRERRSGLLGTAFGSSRQDVAPHPQCRARPTSGLADMEGRQSPLSDTSETNQERREHLRADVRLPVELYHPDAERRLAEGTTVNLSAGGLLAECHGPTALRTGDRIKVHLGMSRHSWPDQNGMFPGLVRRVEEGARTFVVVQVSGRTPPALMAPELIGTHPSILDVKRQLLEVADYDVNVLIRGESGTGKNVAATMIHRYSHRLGAPFVRVNCPAIPDTLLESQLFGHEKGAFTDAKQAQPGLFRVADRGTLVLDEISAIPGAVQAKLLQAIEDKTFIPVGGREAVSVDVRIVATTNDHLERRIRDGSFREDLFYRLNEVTLTLPPLRDRKEDILLLAGYFLRKYATEFRKEYRPLDRSTVGMLLKYSWPGNVRELENTIKRGVLMGQFDTARAELYRPPVEPAALSPLPSAAAPLNGRSMREAREEAEQVALIEALQAAGFDRTGAAARLGVSYRTLLRRIKKYGLKV